MLEGSIAFTLSGATEFKKMGFGSLTIWGKWNFQKIFEGEKSIRGL